MQIEDSEARRSWTCRYCAADCFTLLDWRSRLISDKEESSEINSPTPAPDRPRRGICRKLKPGCVRSDRKAEVAFTLSLVSVTARMSARDLLTIKSFGNGPFSRTESTLTEKILKSWSGVVGPGFRAMPPARSRRETALKSSSIGLRWTAGTFLLQQMNATGRKLKDGNREEQIGIKFGTVTRGRLERRRLPAHHLTVRSRWRLAADNIGRETTAACAYWHTGC